MFLLRELALLALIASAEAGFYSGKNSPVLEVNSKNFKKEILESGHAAVRIPRYCWKFTEFLANYASRLLSEYSTNLQGQCGLDIWLMGFSSP